MLRFRKSKAPDCLSAWQSTPGATWSSLGRKDRGAIRRALSCDQGALCAYCQRRIPVLERKGADEGPRAEEEEKCAAEAMKIEHWQARSTSREGSPPGDCNDFQWRHLLGVCTGDTTAPAGRQGAPERTFHCDHSRGNEPLFLHPVEGEGPSPRALLRYLGNGTIDSHDERAKRDVEQALNLNAPFLQRARVQVLEALRRRLGRRQWSRQGLVHELEIHTLRPDTKAPEHIEMVRYHLERWLRKR